MFTTKSAERMISLATLSSSLKDEILFLPPYKIRKLMILPVQKLPYIMTIT
jgi:hypothetical protein